MSSSLASGDSVMGSHTPFLVVFQFVPTNQDGRIFHVLGGSMPSGTMIYQSLPIIMRPSLAVVGEFYYRWKRSDSYEAIFQSAATIPPRQLDQIHRGSSIRLQYGAPLRPNGISREWLHRIRGPDAL